MTTDTLHTRLLAAVQQRMDAARAATPGPWRVCRMGDNWAVEQDGPRDAHLIFESGECGEMAHASWPRTDVKHIAANDPATVLRHCERDLRVLERHAEDDGYCNACCVPFVVGEVQEATWPCAEILGLAAAYGVDVDG